MGGGGGRGEGGLKATPSSILSIKYSFCGKSKLRNTKFKIANILNIVDALEKATSVQLSCVVFSLLLSTDYPPVAMCYNIMCLVNNDMSIKVSDFFLSVTFAAAKDQTFTIKQYFSRTFYIFHLLKLLLKCNREVNQLISISSHNFSTWIETIQMLK